jgi:homoserine kinase type II
LSEYAIGSLIGCSGIAEGVENSNFLLRTTAGAFILTLFEKRVDAQDLPWFLGLMEHLAGHGITCPLPVHDRCGQVLRRMRERPAAITTFLPGAWPRQIDTSHCAAVGHALAALHLAGRDYAPSRPNALGPLSWPGLFHRSRARADEVMPGLSDELQAALTRIIDAWPEGLEERGHIHADLFPDNVFFLNGRLSGMIDFYFAATDLFVYDVAVCVNAWCFDDDQHFNEVKARALLSAYCQLRPLSASERIAMPALCQGAALRFLLTRLYDWLNTPADALVVRKDPLDYLARLRFHLTAKDERVYGL